MELLYNAYESFHLMWDNLHRFWRILFFMWAIPQAWVGMKYAIRDLIKLYGWARRKMYKRFGPVCNCPMCEYWR